MAKCEHCGKEMLKAGGCTLNMIWYPKPDSSGSLAYCSLVPYKPIRWWPWHNDVAFTWRCPDCRALPGRYHHPGCDMEICPKCGEQLIGCDCSDPAQL